jgi:hypothetical protein
MRWRADQRTELEQLCRYITRPAIANERLKRVFDIEHCPNCGGALKIIAAPSTHSGEASKISR